MKSLTTKEIEQAKAAFPKAIIWANTLEQHAILKKRKRIEHYGVKYTYVCSLGALVRDDAIAAIKQQRKEQSCQSK